MAFTWLTKASIVVTLSVLIMLQVSASTPEEQVLELYDRNGELRWLGGEENKFAALLREALSAQTKGIVILLPDWGNQIDDDSSLGYLRRLLPKHGWVTLAITPPPTIPKQDHISPLEKPEELDPKRPTPELARPIEADEWLNDEAQQQIDTYQQALKIRMQETLKIAANYPGFYLVIAEGSSAGWLSLLYSDETLQAPDALITLSAYLPQHTLNRSMTEAMAKSAIPQLDLFSRYDNRWVQDTVALRPMLAEKHFKLHYRQRELFGSTENNRQDERLWKEIYGWLTYLGW